MRLSFVAAAVFGLVLGAAAAVSTIPGLMERLLPGRAQIVSIGGLKIGGTFALTDHTGRRVTDQDYRGRYLIVTFGFTPGQLPIGLDDELLPVR